MIVHYSTVDRAVTDKLVTGGDRRLQPAGQTLHQERDNYHSWHGLTAHGGACEPTRFLMADIELGVISCLAKGTGVHCLGVSSDF